MNDELYRLLNEMDHDVENYEEIPATEQELIRWKKNFQKQIQSKQSFLSGKAVAVAACVILILLMTLSPLHQSVYAGINIVTYNIRELLGTQENLDDYSVVVGTSRSKAGYTITLNDVILDGNDLLVSYTTTFPTPIKESGTEPFTFVGAVVNGKISQHPGTTGASSMVDEYNSVSCDTLYLEDLPTNQPLHLKLNFTIFDTAQDKNITTIKNFKFTVDGTKLAKSTLEIPLKTDYTLPDGDVIHFTTFTSNPLRKSLLFDYESVKGKYDFKVKLQDASGNKAEASSMYLDGDHGGLIFDEDIFCKDATELTATVYAAPFPEGSGEITADYTVNQIVTPLYEALLHFL